VTFKKDPCSSRENQTQRNAEKCRGKDSIVSDGIRSAIYTWDVGMGRAQNAYATRIVG